MENKTLYPSLPTAPDDPVVGPTAFRLNRILEIQTLLLNEQRIRSSLAKKYRRAANTVDGINTIIAAGSVVSGVGSVTALSTVIGAPIAVGLSAAAAIGGLLCMTGRMIGRRFETTIKKHDRIVVAARAKKNSIDVIISKAIQDNDISDVEFKTVIDEWDRYQALKDNIRTKSNASRPQIISDEDVKKLILRGREEERREMLNRLGCGMVAKVKNQDLKSHIQCVRDLNIRDDDVYLVAFPKSGTHWVWEIMVMLRRGSAEYEPNSKEAIFLDFKDADTLDKVPSPRVLNCHYPCRLTPKGILEKGIKIVYVQRNPKDVFVSFYHHMKNFAGRSFTGSFQEYLPMCIGSYGLYQFYPWYKHVKEWERFSKEHSGQILSLFYEDIKEDPVREIKKINTFLNTDRDDDLVTQIAEACHFENLKKADAEVKVKDQIFKDLTTQDNKAWMYRKGEVGDWKNHFTVAQNEEMDQWLEDNLVDTELTFKYTL